MKSLCRGVVVAFLVCSSMGCKKGADAGAAGDGGDTASFPAGSGLGAAGNDAAVVTQIKAIIASCGAKWDAKTGWPDDCVKPYVDMKVDNKDATFVALMEDPDAKVRELGVSGLDMFGSSYKNDKDLAPRVVAALEREPALPFNAEMAYKVDDIDLSAVPAVGPRIKALGINPKTPSDVRVTITSFWPQESGESNTLAYDVVKANSTSTDKKIKISALDGYAEFDENKHDEACAYWAANMTNADSDIAGVAYGHLTHGWTGVNAHDAESDWYVSGGGHSGDLRCPQLDQALTLAETMAKAGTIKDDKFVYGPAAVATDKKATPAQKKAAITALRETIQNKANQNRSQAVNALVDADPSEKSFIAKFESDPDVGFTVKGALKPKKK